MPYKSIKKRRAAVRKSQAKRRQKKSAELARVQAPPDWPSDPALAVIEWAPRALVVPPGHPRSGQRFELPGFLADVVVDIYREGIREILLLIARKNAKSAAIAVVLLAHLCGPLRRFGWRCGVASISKIKAGELKSQAQQIAEASGLEDLRFLRSPAPGRIESPWGSVDILSADKNSGASAGFDLAIIDELGLLEERHRDLVNSMRSAVSARNGRFLALSVRGTAPFVPEILDRRGDPALAIHEYAAPPDAAIDDQEAWHLANPGLRAGIKSLSYMEDESRRVSVTILDQSSFRALDMNQAQDPSAHVLISLSDWRACELPEGDELPEREGSCYLGVDLGGSASMTAAVAYFPDTGRLETWAAFPAEPGLADRGKADGAGGLYQAAFEAGTLQLHPGRTVNAGRFYGEVIDSLKGSDIKAIGSDRYRRAESEQAYADAELTVPAVWRGTGASATADGSADVRSFQASVLERAIVARPDGLLRLALSESECTYDDRGNPALDKSRKRARIDLVQAAVIATGLARLNRLPKRRGRYFVAGQ